jgi:hypothetical protein
MSAKQETHAQALRPLLLAALDSPGQLAPSDFNMALFSLNADLSAQLLDPDIAALEDYLIDHSSLPGKRANLELIAAFADEVAAICTAPDVSLHRGYISMQWLIWRLLNRYPPALYGRDPDSPLQMPQICASVALGEWASAFKQIELGVSLLLDLADSPLWRIREGVAMGFQRMFDRAWASTYRRMSRRSLDARAYEWRALIAGIAEPRLLTDPVHALDGLDLHYNALAYFRRLPPDSRRSDPVRTLRQALGYSVSVVVAAAPDAGFPLMQAWALWADPDITWIIRENLKKNRLSKWPDRVEAVRAVVDDC